MYKRTGFTFIEVCLSCIILSLLFGCVYKIMSYARSEGQRGQWIVQTSSELMNTVRLISLRLNQKNYPSVIEKGKTYKNIRVTYDEDKDGEVKVGISGSGGGSDFGGFQLYSYKEYVKYDSAGRIVDFKINDKCKDFEVYCKSSALPSNEEQIVLRFPVCESEELIDLNHKPGKINWYVFTLGKKDKNTGYSDLYLDTYEDKYASEVGNGIQEEERAFFIKRNFQKNKLKPERRKLLISDVSNIEISNEAIKYTKGSRVKHQQRSRNIITVTINCTNPKDKKVNLQEVISVTNDTEVYPLS